MRFASLVAAGTTALALGGCATWSTSSVDKRAAESTPLAADAKKKLPSDVIITDNDVLDRQYHFLGDVTVTVNKTTLFHPDPTRELVNTKLKEKGAELGADAVILVRYGNTGIGLLSWGSLEGKGRAIRFN